MSKKSTYTVLPNDSDSDSNQFANLYGLLSNLDAPKRKGKKKKKKGKKKSKKFGKKHEKVLANWFGERKKHKKAKKLKKSKSRKRAEWELRHRIVEKAADTTLCTTSDVVKMYAESKFFPDGRNCSRQQK